MDEIQYLFIAVILAIGALLAVILDYHPGAATIVLLVSSGVFLFYIFQYGGTDKHREVSRRRDRQEEDLHHHAQRGRNSFSRRHYHDEHYVCCVSIWPAPLTSVFSVCVPPSLLRPALLTKLCSVAACPQTPARRGKP